MKELKMALKDSKDIQDDSGSVHSQLTISQIKLTRKMSLDHYSSSANKVFKQTNDLVELSSLKSTSYNKRGIKN